LDLDGTLLFQEYLPNALVIEGRRRNSYIAMETIAALKDLQAGYDLVLATGRSVSSVMTISNQLEGQGVRIKGMVAENGGAWIGEDREVVFMVSEKWMEGVSAALQVLVEGVFAEFKTCLVLLKPQPEKVEQATDFFWQRGLNFRLLPDGNKLFVLAENTDKRNGLLEFLGDKSMKLAVGIGNDLNDLEWLQVVNLAAAPRCAKEEVIQAVSAMKGMISENKGHQGIQEILVALQKR
jgi:hydroxymethylpyrimidine pyrophosphatase-like HAD family hydrolase